MERPEMLSFETGLIIGSYFFRGYNKFDLLNKVVVKSDNRNNDLFYIRRIMDYEVNLNCLKIDGSGIIKYKSIHNSLKPIKVCDLKISPSGKSVAYIIQMLVEDEIWQTVLISIDLEGNTEKKIIIDRYEGEGFRSRINWIDDNKLDVLEFNKVITVDVIVGEISRVEEKPILCYDVNSKNVLYVYVEDLDFEEINRSKLVIVKQNKESMESVNIREVEIVGDNMDDLIRKMNNVEVVVLENMAVVIIGNSLMICDLNTNEVKEIGGLEGDEIKVMRPNKEYLFVKIGDRIDVIGDNGKHHIMTVREKVVGVTEDYKMLIMNTRNIDVPNYKEVALNMYKISELMIPRVGVKRPLMRREEGDDSRIGLLSSYSRVTMPKRRGEMVSKMPKMEVERESPLLPIDKPQRYRMEDIRINPKAVLKGVEMRDVEIAGGRIKLYYKINKKSNRKSNRKSKRSNHKRSNRK